MAESENKYIVVEDEEGELSIIHIKWMFSASDGSNVGYWPRENQSSKAKRGEIPDLSKWRRFNISKIYSIDSTWELALKHLKKAEETSNMESDTDTSYHHRAAKYRRIPNDVDGDSEDSPPRKVTVSMPRKTAECKLTLDEHQNNMIQESGNLI
nr:uncharacterized protein LOC123759121 [Procambarus clarkii]